MARKVRSVTVPAGEAPPPWATYLVMLCSNKWSGDTLPSQAFSCRADAERWGKAAAAALPSTRNDSGPTHWVLVYALGADRQWRPTFGGGICYLAYDGGGERVKMHRIPTGYGVRGIGVRGIA